MISTKDLSGLPNVARLKTFCVWTEDGTTWHCNPMVSKDASKDLLSRTDRKAQTYVEYRNWFPADLPLKAVHQLVVWRP